MAHRRRSSPLVVLCGALVAAVIAAAALGAAAAHAAGRSCSPPAYPGSGYFTSLKVSHTTCATGRRVALAWYHCRTQHGRAGKCDKPVLGFTCTEKRVSIPTEFDARVTCHKGRATVVHTYQQNT